MKIKLCLSLLVVVLCVGQAQASSFKCNNDFVSVGDHKVRVLLRCGEPFFAEIISSIDKLRTEEWTYKSRAYKGFLRVLTFHGGKLVDIAVAEKVD